MSEKLSLNSVNCLGSPEMDNQQPSLDSDILEGSTTSSESQVDNNSATKAGQPFRWIDYEEWKFLTSWLKR